MNNNFLSFFFSLIQDLTGPTILSKPHCQQIKSTVLPGTSEWKGRTVMLSLWELNASKIPSQRTALPHFQTTECQQGEEHLRSRLLTWMETSHEEMTSTWKKLQLSAVFCTYTVNSNSTEKYEWGKTLPNLQCMCTSQLCGMKSFAVPQEVGMSWSCRQIHVLALCTHM